MFKVYWTPVNRESDHGYTQYAGPFETRANAERFVIALPQAINPSRERLADVKIVEEEDDQ